MLSFHHKKTILKTVSILKSILTLCAVSILFIANAQKVIPANVELAQKFKKQLPDEKLMAVESNIQYHFYNPKKSTSIEVAIEETESYLSLSSNANYVKRSYFDNYETIEGYKILSEKKKPIGHDKVCGHIEDEGIFYSDAKVCAYNINFKNIGQLTKYQGQKKVLDPRYLTRIYLQTPLYTQQRSISFQIPQHIEIEFKEMHFEGYDIKKEESVKGDLKTVTYHVENLNGFPKEEDMPSFMHFVPHILVLTKSQTIDGKKEAILSNTQDLYDWYQELKSGVANETTNIKPLVAEILQSTKAETEREKIEELYYWVQDNIKYIAFEDGIAAFQPEDAHTVLFNRYGDCKGMSNLLKEMLAIAGFDARLTWVGTRRIPYDYSTPSLAVDNHMVCSVMLQDTTLVLDATEPLQSIDYVGERIQGRPVLIEDGNSYLIKELATENMDINLVEEQINFGIDAENNLLTGKGHIKINGESKKKIKMFSDAVDTDDQEKLMEYVVNNGKSKEYELVKVSDFDRKRPAEIEYTCKLSNQIQQFNDNMYIDLDPSKQLYQSKVEKERIAPIDFNSRRCISEHINLTLPENMEVENLPKPLNIANDLLSAKIEYQLKDNNITYKKNIKIFKSILRKDQFETWNKAIDQLNEFYGNQIVLKKK